MVLSDLCFCIFLIALITIYYIIICFKYIVHIIIILISSPTCGPSIAITLRYKLVVCRIV